MDIRRINPFVVSIKQVISTMAGAEVDVAVVVGRYAGQQTTNAASTARALS